MSNPNALVTRIYKARYFNDCHLLKASRGTGSSFVLTELWETKQELGKGYKWVLGDENDIKIFNDRWLRGKKDLCVENHHVNNVRNDKVCAYFRSNTKEWDKYKVRQTFHENDVQCIFQTRIPYNQVKDRVAWREASDDKYSVKSGYHFWYDNNGNMTSVIESNG